MIKEKDLVFNVIKVVIYMKDNLEMIKEKDKVDINLQMEICNYLNIYSYVGDFVNDKIEGKGKKKFINGD